MSRVGYGFHRRARRFSEPGDFLQVIDHEGNLKFVKVVKDEPLGFQPIIMAGYSTDGNTVLCGYNAHTIMGEGTQAAAASTTGLIPLPYLEPSRENRIYEAIPYLYAINPQSTGTDCVQKTKLELPVTAYLIWEHPAGSRRGGTDLQTNQISRGPITNVNRGGVNSGRIPLPLLHLDASIFWGTPLTFWIIYGTYPAVGLENRTKGRNLGTSTVGECPENTVDDDLNYFLGMMGRKYEVVDPTSEELDLLLKRELPFRSAVVGGIPQVSTKA